MNDEGKKTVSKNLDGTTVELTEDEIRLQEETLLAHDAIAAFIRNKKAQGQPPAPETDKNAE